ncbi:aminotransferase class III-fold pyridoxal phosphate-dependent enzyme [Mycobacterium camsae]|uniref:aminotransferase class III-fold pyridoxal phosphate-dependent enzyme n=1 Tax=Mycobacterium gordonae TaxID=1778 RepID=UPI0019822ED2|nr:aminotransferase class III-fold pyridoxal phosphate-dependent enzyme [Mycobacterium gordonae]
MNIALLEYLGGAMLLIIVARGARQRLILSLAKQRSLAGHDRFSRLVARMMPRYDYDETIFFRADDASPDVEARRRAGFEQLVAQYTLRYPLAAALSRQIGGSISDLEFTARYRVPIPFSRLIRNNLQASVFVQSSCGATVTDIDSNQTYDVSGSYGVNLFGIDFYKDCIDFGIARARELGPVLGAYHPVVADNVARLREISGLDEVSFHMSGTEAVMQAVRLARYHTKRKYLVRFCGAYHGWSDDVQPGVGNPIGAQATFTLKDMASATLRVLRTRRDIACVLVNPVQAMHPNGPAPSDSLLIDSGRRAHFDRTGYAEWLAQLRRVCSERNIVLIFDEVFSGFRLSQGGAQEYFGVRADMVTYGKSVGGGLPVGVVCGRSHLMKRYREQRPADVCFARGTFNSHPYVMGAMNEFLRRLQSEPIQAIYRDLDGVWARRAGELNQRLAAAQLPVQIAHMSSIWTVIYQKPSRYNWMLQYYLRAEGLALSWVGTARLIFSLNYSDAEFAAVADRFVSAAEAMLRDAWWQGPTSLTDKAIRRHVLKELHQAWWATCSIGSSSSPRTSWSGARQ